MDWPYSTYTTGPSPNPEENRFFTIEGKVRNHYVDFPNFLVQDYFSKILNDVPQTHPNNHEKQYEAAVEIKNRYNEILNEMGLDFLQLRIVDHSSSRLHPYYGIQIHGLNAEKFDGFLDSLAATDEATLEEKYHYLHGSKYPISEVESKSRSKSADSRTRVQGAVANRVDVEKESIAETTEALLTDIEAWRDELQTYWRRTLWQRFNAFPAVHLYLLEMETIVTNIGMLASRGSIPPSYRELRKLLENLSWAIFDDLLFINADYATVYADDPSINRPPPRPFNTANQQWYNWNRGRDSPDFEAERRQLRDRIHNHCTRPRLDYVEKYGTSKGVITEVLKTDLSYPLYIALAGIEVADLDPIGSYVTPVNPDHLKPGVRLTLHNVLRSLKDGQRLGKLDEEFIERTADDLLDVNLEYLVPPFPSNKQVIGYLDSLWHQDLAAALDTFYREYSFFIHSYPSSWQVFRHSSVLEFKIFKHELDRFSETIATVVDCYLTDYHRN